MFFLSRSTEHHTMINSNIFLLCASWLQNILFYSKLNVLLKCFVQFNPPFNCKCRDLQSPGLLDKGAEAAESETRQHGNILASPSASVIVMLGSVTCWYTGYNYALINNNNNMQIQIYRYRL